MDNLAIKYEPSHIEKDPNDKKKAAPKAFYGQSQALHGLDFALAEGSIVTLLGANGAGKTTTLRALCGMVRMSGEIRFDGEPIAGRATEDIVRLGVGHVPEARGTFVRGMASAH